IARAVADPVERDPQRAPGAATVALHTFPPRRQRRPDRLLQVRPRRRRRRAGGDQPQPLRAGGGLPVARPAGHRPGVARPPGGARRGQRGGMALGSAQLGASGPGARGRAHRRAAAGPARRPRRPGPPQEPAMSGRTGSERGGPLVATRDLMLLAAGTHRDPHTVLGAHPHAEGTVVRVLRPHAESVRVRVGGQEHPLEFVGYDMFAGVLPYPELMDYRLATTYPGGHTVESADGYRFLPTLGEFDLHLIGTGRHEHLWHVLGAHPRRYDTL